ncbi:unnamed protein product [Nesidiocoris tenuis]|uniref:Uncharacterized protein n=1 Tax=Nesidiocoris tenuis TaxID=355587 RepID=A0A6H5GBS7_9HEMI|nr:unnamed protein product [Nesidiocoris tenuis]
MSTQTHLLRIVSRTSVCVTLVKENDFRAGRALMTPEQIEESLPENNEESSVASMKTSRSDSTRNFLFLIIND